eukprot:5928873-Prymnesium_polylepis.2
MRRRAGEAAGMRGPRRAQSNPEASSRAPITLGHRPYHRVPQRPSPQGLSRGSRIATGLARANVVRVPHLRVRSVLLTLGQVPHERRPPSHLRHGIVVGAVQPSRHDRELVVEDGAVRVEVLVVFFAWREAHAGRWLFPAPRERLAQQRRVAECILVTCAAQTEMQPARRVCLQAQLMCELATCSMLLREGCQRRLEEHQVWAGPHDPIDASLGAGGDPAGVLRSALAGTLSNSCVKMIPAVQQAHPLPRH